MHCMSTLFSILCSFVLPFYYLMLLSFSIWGSCASFMIPWRKLTLRHFENKQCKGWQCHSKKVPFWPLVEARPSKVLYIYIYAGVPITTWAYTAANHHVSFGTWNGWWLQFFWCFLVDWPELINIVRQGFQEFFILQWEKKVMEFPGELGFI